MRLVKSYLIFIFLLVGSFAFSQNSKTTRFEVLIDSLKKYSEENDSFDEAVYYFSLQDWDSVLVYSSQALMGNPKENLLNYCHYIRGYSFMRKKLFLETKKEYAQIQDHFPFYQNIIRNLGGIALEQRKFKLAINYFERLIGIPEDSVISFEKSSVIHDLGISYFHLSKFDKAEELILKSIDLQKKKKDTLRLVGSYMDLANVYYEQYKDDIAIPYFKKAYELSKKVPDFAVKRKAALNMAVVEENRKDLTKAIVYRKEFEQWKDSLHNEQKVWDIAQVEKKLAVSQKQKEINSLASENEIRKLQRNGFIVMSLLLFITLLGGAYFYIQLKKSNKIIHDQREELDLLNQAKDKLFSIVSHDLRSSVNLMKRSNSKLSHEIQQRNFDVLDSLVHENATIANSSSNLLENLLNWATLQTHQLYFSIDTIDLFSLVQQVSFNYEPLFNEKNIKFENKVVAPTFVLADLDSMKIIIRNLLDNAIKFSRENGSITIYSDSENLQLENLIIEDTGLGISEEIRRNLLQEGNLLNKKKGEKGIGTGLGLQLCMLMVKRNNGFLDIESEEGKGTKVIVKLHKVKQNEES